MNIDTEGRVHFTETEIEQAENPLTKFKGCRVSLQVDYGDGAENTARLTGEVEAIDQEGRFVIGIDPDFFVLEDGERIESYDW